MSATANTDNVSVSREIPGIGRLDFEQSERRRDYWLLPEGAQRRTRLPSVTSILRDTWPKPALLEWYAREPNASAILKTASERGKAVHRFVEEYLTTGTFLDFADFPPDFHGYLRGAASFLWEYDPIPVSVELLVCHPELNYAGRLDLLAEIGGQLTLVDYKSNPKGNVYPEAHVQTRAYAVADERCGGVAVERTMIVGIAEDGTTNVVDGADASKMWGACLDFYRTMKRFEKALP